MPHYLLCFSTFLPQNRIRAVALKTTNNINILIKDLFHNPPSYKATVTLSFTRPAVAKAAAEATGQKRPGITPVTFESDSPPKKNKGEQRFYSPPSGKFSDKAGNYTGGGKL